MTLDDLDPLLPTAECAALAGITRQSWRRLGPRPDDAGDMSEPAHRRSLRWRRSSVVRYMAARSVYRGEVVALGRCGVTLVLTLRETEDRNSQVPPPDTDRHGVTETANELRERNND